MLLLLRAWIHGPTRVDTKVRHMTGPVDTAANVSGRHFLSRVCRVGPDIIGRQGGPTDVKGYYREYIYCCYLFYHC